MAGQKMRAFKFGLLHTGCLDYDLFKIMKQDTWFASGARGSNTYLLKSAQSNEMPKCNSIYHERQKKIYSSIFCAKLYRQASEIEYL